MTSHTNNDTASIEVKQASQKRENQFDFEGVEPYENAIDPTDLLVTIFAMLKRYIVIDDEQAVAVTLWTVLTWVIDHVSVLPLLIINAPEKACGKTQLLELVGRMSYRPLPASNVSTAAMFRSIDAWHPTLLIDEADTFFRDKPDLAGIINAGHTHSSAYVMRSAGEDHTPKAFSVWSAKAIAGIDLERHLQDATMSRGIIINMRRKMPNESVERMRHADRNEFDEIKPQLARFAVDYADQISQARPEMPEKLSDRQQDNWEPLLAIAGCAGKEWLERATQAALKLSTDSESSVSIANQLLASIQDVFESKGVDKIKTADLIAALVEDEEMPWATFNRGSWMTPRQLANQLRKYRVKPKTVRFGQSLPKGYDRGQFQEVFDRYLPQDLPQRRNDSPEAMPAMECSVADDTQQSGNAKQSEATPKLKVPDIDYGDY